MLISALRVLISMTLIFIKNKKNKNKKKILQVVINEVQCGTKHLYLGKGLYPMKIIIEHVKIRTRVQEWTCVSNPTWPVITFTGHKSHPCIHE